jgi:hypothetical protein
VPGVFKLKNDIGVRKIAVPAILKGKYGFLEVEGPVWISSPFPRGPDVITSRPVLYDYLHKARGLSSRIKNLEALGNKCNY